MQDKRIIQFQQLAPQRFTTIIREDGRKRYYTEDMELQYERDLWLVDENTYPQIPYLRLTCFHTDPFLGLITRSVSLDVTLIKDWQWEGYVYGFVNAASRGVLIPCRWFEASLLQTRQTDSYGQEKTIDHFGVSSEQRDALEKGQLPIKGTELSKTQETSREEHIHAFHLLEPWKYTELTYVSYTCQPGQDAQLNLELWLCEWDNHFHPLRLKLLFYDVSEKAFRTVHFTEFRISVRLTEQQ